MKNKSELILTSILIPLDYIMMIIGGLFAFWLRFRPIFFNRFPVSLHITKWDFIVIASQVALLGIITFIFNGLYSFRRTPFYKIIAKVFFSMSTTVMIFVVYLFFIKDRNVSRFIILFGTIGAIVFVLIGRAAINMINRFLYKKGYTLKGIILIGEGDTTNELEKILCKNQSKYGYKIISILKESPDLIKNIKKLTKKRNIAEIWLAETDISKETSVQIIEYSHVHHLVFKYVTGQLTSRMTNIEVDVISHIPMVKIKRTSLDGWGRIAKRVMDIVGSLSFIILFSPILLIAALLVKITSRGPIFADIPKRAGKHSKPFKCLKFRSMYVGAHKSQNNLKSERDGLFKLKNDPRITPLGNFIRKYSIDELPQFFNVLIGQMSIVGPRPHYTYEYKNRHKRVLMFKTGITGLGQISGRSDLTFDEEVKLDLWYIENWSIWLDLWILIKTPFALMGSRNAS
jgi:exopolysaccharide biosynthesis polyprenyl glycosylphosphotransferase